MARLVEGTDKLTAPDYRPRPSALTNREVVRAAQHFLEYAQHIGRRATPHSF
jgi:hypothetical protein